ncbi:MAG: ParA family protein [Rhodomicrobium sp.]
MSIPAEFWSSLLAKILAAIIAPTLIASIYFIFRRTHRAMTALQYVDAALKAVAREQTNDLWTEGPGFWLKMPIIRPANYANLQGTSIPILMVAATKGGVGKTTLSGSLAAHFAIKWTQRRQQPDVDRPLRVLVIDQDFQGSFTTMTVDVNHRYMQPSKANRLVSGELGKGGVVQEAEPITQPGMRHPLSIRTIPAYYDLAQAENRMLINWLFPLSDQSLISMLLHFFRIRDKGEDKSTKDVRYLLAEALLDPLVQANFDLIIIDAPPRLTTSHIQAMCAATHLLIPTILDNLSGDAVARYLDQIATHKLGTPNYPHRAICPHLQPIGVVCTLLPSQPNLNLEGPLKELRQRIAAARLQPDIVPQDCFIKNRPVYRNEAGERIAYAAASNDQQHEALRAEVDELGKWLGPRLGAQFRGWTYHES